MAEKAIPLPKGHDLDQYRIEKLLGEGGFSCVYLATDTTTDTPIVIKEYYPKELARRKKDYSVHPKDNETASLYQLGFKRFFDEGITLAKMDHPNIINVHSFFRANETAYMTMDFTKGYDLRWFIKHARDGLDEEFLMCLFPRVLDGLKAIHENGLLHLDIKPSNILLPPSGIPLLIDFGAVQKLTTRTVVKGIQTLTHGYAPPEMYNKGDLGPWTDIYAVGMTMRECLLGKREPIRKKTTKKIQPIALLKTIGQKHNYTMLDVIDRCTSPNMLERPQSVSELLNAFCEDDSLKNQIDKILKSPRGSCDKTLLSQLPADGVSENIL